MLFKLAKVELPSKDIMVMFTINLEGRIIYNYDNQELNEYLIGTLRNIIINHQGRDPQGEIKLTQKNLYLFNCFWVDINRLEPIFTKFEFQHDQQGISYTINELIYNRIPILSNK